MPDTEEKIGEVPGVGLEPTRIAPADFKSAASADSATPAKAKSACYDTKLPTFGDNLAM